MILICTVSPIKLGKERRLLDSSYDFEYFNEYEKQKFYLLYNNINMEINLELLIFILSIPLFSGFHYLYIYIFFN